MQPKNGCLFENLQKTLTIIVESSMLLLPTPQSLLVIMSQSFKDTR
jgi:hypothetical protein